MRLNADDFVPGRHKTMGIDRALKAMRLNADYLFSKGTKLWRSP